MTDLCYLYLLTVQIHILYNHHCPFITFRYTSHWDRCYVIHPVGGATQWVQANWSCMDLHLSFATIQLTFSLQAVLLELYVPALGHRNIINMSIILWQLAQPLLKRFCHLHCGPHRPTPSPRDPVVLLFFSYLWASRRWTEIWTKSMQSTNSRILLSPYLFVT